MHLVNDRDRPDGIFLPTYYFLSANGKKLPRLGAILCHSKAESETSTHLTERQKKFIKFLGITNFIKKSIEHSFSFHRYI